MARIYEGRITQEIKELEKALSEGESFHPSFGFNHPKSRSYALLTAALVISAMSVAGCVGPVNLGEPQTELTSTNQPSSFSVDWMSYSLEKGHQAGIKSCPKGNYTDGDYLKARAKIDDPEGLKNVTLRTYHTAEDGTSEKLYEMSTDLDGTLLARPANERPNQVLFMAPEGKVKPGTVYIEAAIKDQLEKVERFTHTLNATFIAPGSKSPCDEDSF